MLTEEEIISSVRNISTSMIFDSYKRGDMRFLDKLLSICSLRLTITKEELVECGIYINSYNMRKHNVIFQSMNMRSLRRLMSIDLLNHVVDTNLSLSIEELDNLMEDYENKIMDIIPFLVMNVELLDHICIRYQQYLRCLDTYITTDILHTSSSAYPFLSYKYLITVAHVDLVLEHLKTRHDNPPNITYYLNKEHFDNRIRFLRQIGDIELTIVIHEEYTIHQYIELSKLLNERSYIITTTYKNCYIPNLICALEYGYSSSNITLNTKVSNDIIKYCSILFPLGFKRFEDLFGIHIIKKHPIILYPYDIIIVTHDVE